MWWKYLSLSLRVPLQLVAGWRWRGGFRCWFGFGLGLVLACRQTLVFAIAQNWMQVGYGEVSAAGAMLFSPFYWFAANQRCRWISELDFWLLTMIATHAGIRCCWAVATSSVLMYTSCSDAGICEQFFWLMTRSRTALADVLALQVWVLHAMPEAVDAAIVFDWLYVGLDFFRGFVRFNCPRFFITLPDLLDACAGRAGYMP